MEKKMERVGERKRWRERERERERWREGVVKVCAFDMDRESGR